VVGSELPEGGFQIDSKGAATEPSFRKTLFPRAGHRVVGVDAVGQDWLSCGLYILSPDSKTLEVVGRGGRNRVLVKSAAAITSVAIAANASRIAYVTAAGVLGVVGRDGRATAEHAMELQL
jgi:hypothetical protein